MTGNPPRSSTSAPSEGDAELAEALKPFLAKLKKYDASVAGDGKLCFVQVTVKDLRTLRDAALRCSSHTQGVEAMREAAAQVAKKMPRGASFSDDYESGYDHACSRIEDAIRALPVPASADGWQPIETAPKNKKMIVAYTVGSAADERCASESVWFAELPHPTSPNRFLIFDSAYAWRIFPSPLAPKETGR